VSTDSLDLGDYVAHTGTEQYPGGQAAIIQACLDNEVVSVLCGRDAGKSAGLLFLFLEEARQTKGIYHMAVVSQGHSDAERLWKSWVRILGADFITDKANKGQHRFITVTAFGENDGATVYFWSGEAEAIDSVRGVRLNRLAVDEAGFVHKNVLQACVPMLLSRRGKKLFQGTARRGGCGKAWFQEQYERGVEGSKARQEGYVSFNFPSEANPYNDPKKILFERVAMRNPLYPEVKTPEEIEEFDGAFISDFGSCFTNLDACFVLPFRRADSTTWIGLDDSGVPSQPEPDTAYVIGADWGLKYDSTVFSVFDRTTKRQVCVQKHPLRRSYDEYAAHLDKLKRHWNDAFLIADAREAGGYANRHMAEKYGSRYRELALTGFGPNSKGFHVGRMKDMFLNVGWTFLNIPEQRKEFEEFEQRPIGEYNNGYQYTAPAGHHDDFVHAALFASTVLEIEPRKVRPRAPDIEPLSPAWFEAKAKERRRVAVRRGAW
jgi:hypothetical protein